MFSNSNSLPFSPLCFLEKVVTDFSFECFHFNCHRVELRSSSCVCCGWLIESIRWLGAFWHDVEKLIVLRNTCGVMLF